MSRRAGGQAEQPLVEVGEQAARPSARASRQRRTTAYRVANVRPRSSSDDVLLDQREPGDVRRAGARADAPRSSPPRGHHVERGRDREQMPAPMIDHSKTVSRGSRFWNASRLSTPTAARARARTAAHRTRDLLPSTSVANTWLSGTIAPAPITPPPRPTITARAKRSVRMNEKPSLISRERRRPLELRCPRASRRRRDRQPEDDDRRDDVGERVEPERRDRGVRP